MKRSVIGVVVGIVLAGCAAGVEPESRKWTSKAGTVIEGRMVGLVPDARDVMKSKITIRRDDGRVTEVWFHQLSAADHAWLMNHHGDELSGGSPKTKSDDALDSADARVFPVKRVECFDPGELLVPPAGTTFDRTTIPSRGGYEDRSSDAVNLVTNHLFWLCKAGYTKTGIGRDEQRTWQKLQREAAARFRAGKSWEAPDVSAFAAEMLRREGKNIVSIRQWQARTLAPAGFDAITGTPVLMLCGVSAHHRNGGYKWSAVVPVIEAKARQLTIFYRDERIRGRAEDLKPENPSGGTRLPDGTIHHGYKLVFDPGDTSRLATRLVGEELELHIMPDEIFFIDLELAPLPRQSP